MNRLVLVLLCLAPILDACSPKVSAPQEKVEEVVKEEPAERLSPCNMFADASDPDEALESHVIYRDFIKSGNYAEAFDYWKIAYESAPAADGRRDYHFTDGVKIYKDFYNKSESDQEKDEYWSKIEELYDKAAECFPAKAADYKGLKAFELYYNFPDRADKMEIFNLFAETIDHYGLKTPAYVMNPFTDVLITLLREEKISVEEGQKYAEKINKGLEYGLKNTTGSNLEAYKIVNSYVPDRMEDLETVRGFYDCQYYVDKYYKEFENQPNDCDVIRTVISRLKWGNCPDTNQEYMSLIAQYKKNCQVTSTGPLPMAYDCLNNAEYQCAIDNFKSAIENTDNVEKKAKYTLLISKIYYSHLRNFSQARKYAMDAAKIRGNWGEPYMLVGRLYASSGPLCGPGTGWDSQVVVWLALDMWNKAKSIDSSVSAEANKFINQYRQYMPTREDIFQRPNISEGDSYYIGCWIKRNTTVRAR